MSLAQITEKIKNDAQLEADAILTKAKAQIEQVTKQAADESKNISNDYESRFNAEKPEIFRRREIVANLDVKKKHLKAGRDLINDVYNSALEKMKQLDRGEYLSLCESLLAAAVSTQDEQIVVSADERYIDKDWVDAYNKKKNTKLVLSDEKAEIAGGFILVQGKIRTNCSWDMLIQVAQEKNESDVVKRLFPSAS